MQIYEFPTKYDGIFAAAFLFLQAFKENLAKKIPVEDFNDWFKKNSPEDGPFALEFLHNMIQISESSIEEQDIQDNIIE